MQDYFKNLEVFSPIKKDKFVEIVVPVAMDINYNLLKLTIIPLENGYVICDDGKTFKNFNNSTDYYLNLFNEKNPNHSFEIKLKNDRIFKQYPDNFNIQVAVNEFVRFFVYLDDFILDNNII